MKTMVNNKLLVSLVAIIAVFAMIANVAAFADITSVQVDDIEGLSGDSLAIFAGQTVPVRITFDATDNASDVRIKVWISGDKSYSASTERFDVIDGKVYTRTVPVQVPYDIDPSEDFSLEVIVESRNDGIADQVSVDLSVQRESYLVEILDAFMDTKVEAGSNLAVDIVLKNRGMHLAEDTFVTVKIPALGIEKRSYFGDLSPVDQADPDKEDAAERRMLVSIPSNAPAGVYSVEIEAYNSDAVSTISKKVAIVGASESSMVVSPTNSKTFAAGSEGSYSITLVNAGDKVRVYELVFETASGLSLSTDEPVIAVPAGSSKTVTVEASAEKAGTYNFAVNVYSNGELVNKENYVAQVQGSKVSAGNATVVLTVILAIIFVVLLIVLIVLLTRKPEKTEDFGESYY